MGRRARAAWWGSPLDLEAAEGWFHFTCSGVDPGEGGFGKGGAAAPVGCGVPPSGPRSPYQGIPKHPKISQQGERNSHLNYSKTPSLNLTFTNFVTCTNANKSLDNLSLELYWEGEISLCVPSLSTAAVEGLVQSPPGVNNATACCRGEGGSAQGGFVHCHSERALPCWSCNKRANKPTQPNPKVLWQQKAAPAVGVCELPVVRGGRVKGPLCWH